MLDYSYYPFKNKLEEINEEDLLLLKDVSEGWYIDYKVQEVKIAAFAKHLSAFANQYGGWLIIGVDESPDGSRTASEFKGIPNGDLEKLSRDIREASAAHVNPEILYEEKIVKGPLDKIGLSDGKSILIIGIPMSHNTPHIHSTGKIYRRLADQSKPKAEVDRYILDDLWKRGKSYQDKMSNFLKKTPNLPESQSENPWAHIYFKPAQGQVVPERSLGFDQFSKIVRNSDGSIFGVHAPMQAINSTPGGFVARQIEGNDPILATLSIRWWHSGIVRFDIPLNKFDLTQFTDTYDRNVHARNYCLLAHELKYKNLEIVDYSIFMQALASLTNCYLQMLKATGDKRDVYSCFTIRNVFYTSPYIDSDKFINRCREFSLPLTVDKNISVPEEPREANMFLHRNSEQENESLSSQEQQQATPFIFSLPVAFQVFRAVGIISDLDDILKDFEAYGFNKVNNALSNPQKMQ